MWKSLIDKFRRKEGRRGYTMTELLAVIAIIAVVVGIAIPSIAGISRALKFKQRNDYAKTIFMAAQANLSEMRSDGTLPQIQAPAYTSAGRSVVGKSGFPEEDWADEYFFAGSWDTTLYGMVLPVNSVESTLRDKQVIIEYNPYTGNVYAVFYSEESADLQGQYESGIPRDDTSERRKMMIGYYNGSGLASTEVELEKTRATVVYENGEEGVINVRIPMPSDYYGSHDAFIRALSVTLDIKGDISNGQITGIPVKASNSTADAKLDTDGKTVVVSYKIDSLADYKSFANLVMNSNGSSTHLTQKNSENDFAILPGENVTITAKVRFDGISVQIENGVLPGVNPLFNYMEPGSESDKYIVSLTNGRNLQNLNVIAPTVASMVETVIVEEDIYWNRTVDYYNSAYGNGGTYTNTKEAPARCLPYFVPINNQCLLGSSYFSVATTPVIQDKHDASLDASKKIISADHADVSGGDHMIANLVIDGTKYEAQTAMTKITSDGNPYYEYYVSSTTEQRAGYYFTGLFAYANTNIADLNVVNPIVKGYSYSGSADYTTATGALLGASGYNALVTNCGAYIDKSIEGYNGAAMGGPKAYNSGADQTWYGVSGQGAVGGLVGYAKSHRTASGDLTDNTSELAFSRSFAAVPVSGDMRGNENRNYGYTNGVGGFIGNAELTNFYNCYSSGDVLATNVYVGAITRSQGSNSGFKPGRPSGGSGMQTSGTKMTDVLVYEGWTSMGAGGFVGTSHGTRYTNCFSTGDVSGTAASGTSKSTAGVGGFAGIMCYDEGFNYTVTHNGVSSTERIEQLTVFDSCYAAGKAQITYRSSNSNKTEAVENFSGANARIYTYSGEFYTDYYKLFAPYYTAYSKVPYYPSTKDADGNSKNDAYYVYKDSYYLSQSATGTSFNVSSNDCASVASYDLLMNLHNYHHGVGSWLSDRVNLIGKYTLTVNNKSYNYKDYYTNQKKNWSTLVTQYQMQLSEGFSAEKWVSATADSTHAYNMSAGVYPFAMLADMDYYGDWPTQPLTGGIAYYEDYKSGSSTTTSLFLDQYYDESKGTALKTAEDLTGGYTLVSDGYAILSGNKSDKVKVKFGSDTKEYTLTNDGEYIPGAEYGSQSFAVFPLTQEAMAAAAAQVTDANFYVKVTATVTTTGYNSTTKTYTLYFNPNVAKSNINPSDGTNVAQDPGSAPSQISIRTARQLAALGSASHSWTSKFNYVQELPVNFNTYTAASYDSYASAVLNEMKAAPAIGGSAAFDGTYIGITGYTDQAEIVLLDAYSADHGIFGTLGSTAKVQNLIVTAKNATVSAAKADSAGVVAAANYGIIENVDLNVSSNASVTAKTNAGLLVGLMGTTGDVGASLTGCDVTVAGTASVSATHAGGVLGSVSNESTVTDCNVNMAKAMTMTGTNAGGFAGSIGAIVKNVNVTLKGITAQATNVGGFAGGITGGSLTTVNVTLNGDCSNGTDYIGGVAGTAANATFASVNTTVGAKLTGGTAAGVVGKGSKLTINNSKVTVSGGITGTAAAAGVAGELGSSCVVAQTPLTLSSTITASNGTAAGYVADLAGRVSASPVSLSGSAVKITGAKEAAGFAGTVSGAVEKGCSVTGSASIESTGGNAAGFAVNVSGIVAASNLTPATTESAAGYLNNSNEKLTVKGGNAAGFAYNVTGQITNCNALCKITGTNVYGFAATNSGTISRCIANVTLSGGHAFVGTNTGTVQYSYGWYGDGSLAANTAVPNANSGKYVSCYFVDLDVQEGEGANDTVVLYDASGVYDTMLPSELAGSLGKLNGKGSEWVKGGDKSAYPYRESLKNKSYLYPMLREHCGDWVTAPQYAYGVLYFEQYADNSWSYHVVDLSDPTETVDKKSLNTTGKLYDKEIQNAGYAVFCKTDTDPFESGWLDAEKIYPELSAAVNGISGNSNNRYTVYGLKATGDLKIKDYNQTNHTLVTYYADAIDITNGTYQIRTPEQFANVGKMADKKFSQTHNIAADDFTTIATFSGEYTSGNYTLTLASAGNTWMTNVTGTVTLGDLTVNGAVSSPIFGTVSEAMSIGKFQTGAVNSNIIDKTSANVTIGGITTGEIAGGKYIVNNVSGGTVTTGAISVSALNGGLFNTVASGATVQGASNSAAAVQINSDVATNLVSSVAGTFKNYNVTVGNMTTSAVGSVSGTLNAVTLNASGATLSKGALVDSMTGTVSSCTVSIPTITVSNVDTFGVITATVPSGKSVTDTTVKVDTINVNDMTLTLGGLVGSNAGTVSSSKVQGTGNGATTINLGSTSSASDRTMIVGGLVGANSATINSSSSANVQITYNQVVTASAGEEEQTDPTEAPATVSDEPEAEGETPAVISEGSDEGIAPQAAAYAENITIGGLVGTNSGTINSASAGGSITTNGSGSGKSYVIGGAIGKDNGGTYTSVATAALVDAKWAGAAAISGADDPAKQGPVGMVVGYVSSGKFSSCSSSASNTTYQFLGQIAKTEKTLGDSGSASDWFASASNEKTEIQVDASKYAELSDAAQSVPLEAREDGSAYNSYSAELSSCTYRNGEKTYQQKLDATYFYLSKSEATGGGYLAEKQTSSSLGNTGTNEWYMIVESNGQYAFNVQSSNSVTGQKITITDGKLKNFDELKNAMWTVNSNKWKNYGTNEYLNMSSKRFTNTSSTTVTVSQSKGQYTVKTGSTSNSTYYLTYFGSSFGKTTKSNSASKFLIYKITQQADQNFWKFYLQSDVGYVCTAVPYSN